MCKHVQLMQGNGCSLPRLKERMARPLAKPMALCAWKGGIRTVFAVLFFFFFPDKMLATFATVSSCWQVQSLGWEEPQKEGKTADFFSRSCFIHFHSTFLFCDSFRLLSIPVKVPPLYPARRTVLEDFPVLLRVFLSWHLLFWNWFLASLSIISPKCFNRNRDKNPACACVRNCLASLPANLDKWSLPRRVKDVKWVSASIQLVTGG